MVAATVSDTKNTISTLLLCLKPQTYEPYGLNHTVEVLNKLFAITQALTPKNGSLQISISTFVSFYPI